MWEFRLAVFSKEINWTMNRWKCCISVMGSPLYHKHKYLSSTKWRSWNHRKLACAPLTFTDGEVQSTINKAKSSQSICPDGISMLLLKHLGLDGSKLPHQRPQFYATGFRANHSSRVQSKMQAYIDNIGISLVTASESVFCAA